MTRATTIFLCVAMIAWGATSRAQTGPRGREAAPPASGAAPNEGRGQAGAALRIERDLEYARVGAESLRLDLYRMNPAAAPMALVVWIPDTTQSRAATPAGALVNGRGFAVASISYRSSATVAEQLRDAKEAVRWLRANAALYNLDASRIAAMGFGRGGQLAALLGTTGDGPQPGDAGGTPGSDNVQAVIDLAGPVTTGDLNPVAFVTRDDAPTLLLHGTADTSVSTQESQKLVAALKVAGVATTLELQVGAGHDLGSLLSPTAMQTITAFLNQHLLGERVAAGLSAFVATPADTYIDPVALDLGGTHYKLYSTPVRGAGTSASYRVYLPPDYQTNPRRRYPVIYFLHGRSVDSKRPITAGYIARADAAIRSGAMPPTIIVIAQGTNTGWYLDAEDGRHPMESVLIKNLIPHVDATYRTVATREGRAIEGHSMGGYGALHLGFKYPDLFAAVTGNSPALVEQVGDDMGSQTFWEREAPAALARLNLAKVRRQAIRIIAGDQDSLFGVGEKLHGVLTTLEVPHEFRPVAGSPHNHDQLLQYETFDTMAFYASVFGRAGRSAGGNR